MIGAGGCLHRALRALNPKVGGILVENLLLVRRRDHGHGCPAAATGHPQSPTRRTTPRPALWGQSRPGKGQRLDLIIPILAVWSCCISRDFETNQNRRLTIFRVEPDMRHHALQEPDLAMGRAPKHLSARPLAVLPFSGCRNPCCARFHVP